MALNASRTGDAMIAFLEAMQGFPFDPAQKIKAKQVWEGFSQVIFDEFAANSVITIPAAALAVPATGLQYTEASILKNVTGSTAVTATTLTGKIS